MKSKTATRILEERVELAQKYKEEALLRIEAGQEGFIEGKNSAEKETKKQLKDLKNKYSSWLTTEQGVKLGKTINQEEVIKLRAKLELIQELEKKCGIK
jgi:hypothetical protein